MKKLIVIGADKNNPNPALGEIVYEFIGCDYGLANDDTRRTGRKHISVTRNPDGSGPSFTIYQEFVMPAYEKDS